MQQGRGAYGGDRRSVEGLKLYYVFPWFFSALFTITFVLLVTLADMVRSGNPTFAMWIAVLSGLSALALLFSGARNYVRHRQFVELIRRLREEGVRLHADVTGVDPEPNERTGAVPCYSLVHEITISDGTKRVRETPRIFDYKSAVSLPQTGIDVVYLEDEDEAVYLKPDETDDFKPEEAGS